MPLQLPRPAPVPRLGRTAPDDGRVSITCRDVGGTVTVTLSGEIDTGNCTAVREAISGAGGTPVSHVTVDMSGVTFIDSAGISALLAARDDVGGGHLDVVAVSAPVNRLLEITGLDMLTPTNR